jgi:hypothetical protein
MGLLTNWMYSSQLAVTQVSVGMGVCNSFMANYHLRQDNLILAKTPEAARRPERRRWDG